MATLPFLITYPSDGVNTDWTIPFTVASHDDVGVKLVRQDGREKRLILGQDYTIKEIDSSLCVVCFVPAGLSLVIWRLGNSTASDSDWSSSTKPSYPSPPPVPPEVTKLTAQFADLEQKTNARLDGIEQDVVCLGNLSSLGLSVSDAQNVLNKMERQEKKLMATADSLQKQTKAMQDAVNTAIIQNDESLRQIANQSDSLQKQISVQANDVKKQIASQSDQAQQTLNAQIKEAQNQLSSQGSNAQNLLAMQASQVTTDFETSIREANQTLVSTKNNALQELQARSVNIQQDMDTLSNAALEIKGSQNELIQAAHQATHFAQIASNNAAASTQAVEEINKTRIATEKLTAQAMQFAAQANRAAWKAAMLHKPRPGIASVQTAAVLWRCPPGMYIINPHIVTSPTEFYGVYPIDDLKKPFPHDGIFFCGPEYPKAPPPPHPPLPPPPPPPVPDSEDWLPHYHKQPLRPPMLPRDT